MNKPTKELEALLSFWKESLNQKNRDYIHPIDRKLLESKKSKAKRFLNHQEVNEKNIDEIERHPKAFHQSIIPKPYFGDLQNATVFYLTTNPGYEHADYYNENTDAFFRQTLANNIHQKLDKKYPFLFLNPAFSHSGGYRYFNKVLGHHLNGNNRSELAKKIAVLELTGYPSKNMNEKAITSLESYRLMKEFVTNDLLKRKNIQIYVVRSSKLWGITNENKGKATTINKGPRNAVLPIDFKF